MPSYEEWKDTDERSELATEYSNEIDELNEEIEKLKERNDSLNNRDINLCRIANGIRDENFALKELLKECREEIGDEIDDCTDHRIELFGKINEVLK